MFTVMKISKSSIGLCMDRLTPHSKRLFHFTAAVQANMLEEVRMKERDVVPLPPEPKQTMEPFVKSLCVGKIDPRVLTYPEFDLGRLNIVEEMASELQKFINGLYSPETPDGLQISRETLNRLKYTGIFGANIPDRYKGGELTCMEINRLGEVLASNFSLFQTLNVHISYISQFFLKYASEQQKDQYLPSLASGDVHFGLAIWEENAGIDLSQIDCSVTLVDGTYKLSGSKMWVSNLEFADKLLVFVNVLGDNIDSENKDISCLIVDKHSPGISAKRMDTVGVNGFGLWEVTFERTPVPTTNLVGDVGMGLNMLMDVTHGRFTVTGAAYASVLRKMLDFTVQHVNFKTVFGMPLIDTHIVQQQLYEVSALIYTLESISYLTANFFDDYEDLDCQVEVAIVQLYACEALSKGFHICSSLLGSSAYLKNSLWNALFCDVQFATMVEHSPDLLRVMIGTLCVQHVGKVGAEEIKLKRNPLIYPKVAMKDFLKFLDRKDDIPMIDKIVSYHLHPLLADSSTQLEQCISHLRFIIQESVCKWGTEIMQKHLDLARIADIAADCYCITAVLGRASRSFCIGLPNTEVELVLARKICHIATERVIRNSHLVMQSPHMNHDDQNLHISNMLAKDKSYKVSHPLARNY